LKNISAHSQCDWESSSLTAKLTTTDLENHSDYSAGAIALSAEGAAITGAGVGYESESQTSLTRSAISQGTITITDEAKQLELTGKTAQETLESINHDTKNAHTAVEQLPDLKALLADQQAMAVAMLTYSQVVPKVIGDYSTNKQKELESQANNETDPTKKAELQAEANKWAEGGIYRVGLHTIAGGLVGDIGGALGAATVASSAPLLESFQNSTTQALIDAGMSADSAASVASGLASITAAGMGALAGSTMGEAGMLNGAATAYTTDANNRQLHDQEKRWIKNHAKEYAQKTGMTPEQAEVLMTKAAMYYVDEGASDALTQKQKDAGFLSLNPYDQNQYAQAYNYMRANSKGEYFTDVYNEDKITRQPFFTVTQAQYANSSYTPSLSQGLVDQSWVMLPIGKGLQESSKVAFEGGKAVSPTLTNGYYGTMNFLYDPYNSAKIIGGIEVANDVFNPSMPPSTNIGYWYFLYDNLKNNTNTIYEAVSK
jgi:hypothetical protein